MKRAVIAAALGVLAALLLFGQAANLYGLFWNGETGRWGYYQLGAGFSVTGNVVSVTALAAPIRIYGVKLTAGPGGYVLPPGTASNVVVYVNGLRYASPEDYSITAGVVKPACNPADSNCNWPPLPSTPVVVADYDK